MPGLDIRGLLPQKVTRRPRVRAPAEVKLTRADSNAALRKEVGERFVDARKLNGWDQSEASRMMGYSNSTQLSLIEQGKRLPPHEVMIKGSQVYGVSLDFLYGLSDEPERDPKAAERHAAMRHVHKLVESSTEAMVGLLLQYLAQGVPSVRTAERLVAASQSLVDEVHRTREVNAKIFDEKLKNGSKLVRAAVIASEACTAARELLTRHERMMEFKTGVEEKRIGVTHPLLDALEGRTQ